VFLGKKKAVGFASIQLQLRLSFLLKTPHAAVLDEETRLPCETHLLKAFTHAMHAVAQALGLGLLSFNTSNRQSTSKHTTYTQPYTIIRKYETTGTFTGYA